MGCIRSTPLSSLCNCDKFGSIDIIVELKTSLLCSPTLFSFIDVYSIKNNLILNVVDCPIRFGLVWFGWHLSYEEDQP
jgi:hypothetical protein